MFVGAALPELVLVRGASAPMRPRSPKKSVLPICQLRLTFLRRRRTITGNRYSGERPFRRRYWRPTLSYG